MPTKPAVFYNPKMALNRDICCSVVKTLGGKKIKFLDLLAGSGAKGIRAANETECSTHLNDANPDAYKLIKRNAKLNRLKVTVSNENANSLLKESASFNFIDIDPFGSPVPFLDSAVMAMREGYIGITATDTAPLCGVYPTACFRKYGAVPLKCEFCHEVGMRILIGHAARVCAKYSKGMSCLLSHSTEHYFRVYVRIETGKKKADETLKEIGYLYYSRERLNREYEKGFLPQAKAGGLANAIAGPLWLGKIKDTEFCKRVLKASAYLESSRLIEAIAGEIEVPFYYDVHKICKKLKTEAPRTERLLDELKSRGYSASKTHFSPTGIKTDAGIKEMEDAILRNHRP